MFLSSFSAFSAFHAALLLLQSDCAVPALDLTALESLPDEALALVLRLVPSDVSVRTTSKRLRQLSLFPLTEDYSTQYIEDEAFRNEVNGILTNPRIQIQLSLSADITRVFLPT